MLVINFAEHGFKVTAEILQEACTACPFWLFDTKTFEKGETDGRLNGK